MCLDKFFGNLDADVDVDLDLTDRGEEDGILWFTGFVESGLDVDMTAVGFVEDGRVLANAVVPAFGPAVLAMASEWF